MIAVAQQAQKSKLEFLKDSDCTQFSHFVVVLLVLLWEYCTFVVYLQAEATIMFNISAYLGFSKTDSRFSAGWPPVLLLKMWTITIQSHKAGLTMMCEKL